MKCNLNLLPFKLDNDIVIDEKYYENTQVKSIKDLHVTGKIDYNLSDEVEINLHVIGTLVLEDSNTLELIDYPIDINIAENLNDLDGESTYFYEKSKNMLDIIEFLWENIVLEVPISVTTSKNITLKGNGWEYNSDREI